MSLYKGTQLVAAGKNQWGNIQGSLDSQTDLADALDAKQIKLTAGENIVLTSEGLISATAKALSANEPIIIDSENKINLNYDNFRIILDSENKLTVDLKDYPTLSETGRKINLSIDSEYKLKAMLYDKDNNLLSTSDIIDLPIEEAIVHISINSEGTILTFTLKNGNKTEVPLGAIIKGLASQVWVDTNYQKKLTAGDNITIDSENKISAVDTKYTAGEAINIGSDNKINVKYDGSSIVLNSEGKLNAITGASTGEFVITMTSGTRETTTTGWEVTGCTWDKTAAQIVAAYQNGMSIKIICPNSAWGASGSYTYSAYVNRIILNNDRLWLTASLDCFGSLYTMQIRVYSSSSAPYIHASSLTCVNGAGTYSDKLYIKSPDGTKTFYLSVDNNGILSTTEV